LASQSGAGSPGIAVAAADEDFEQLSTGSVLGHFRLVRKLGHGGMGVVYLAQDSKLERQVALKLLPPGFHRDRDRLRRFEREARLTAALSHPNIVTVFEIGEWEGRPFIAAEFVDGETPAQILGRGALRAAEALRISGQVLAALGAAHQAGIVHRDLKPGNIMLRRDGLVKVLDFGLAQMAIPEQPRVLAPTDETKSMASTGAGQIVGTPAYMAPEQWEAKAAGARTDLYAFGCVLYEMVSGRCAGRERPPLPSRALERIVRRCLEREPDRRRRRSPKPPNEGAAEQPIRVERPGSRRVTGCLVNRPGKEERLVFCWKAGRKSGSGGGYSRRPSGDHRESCV
jgi:eukaryotic-like serine/threonine-protein kinase